MVYVLSSSVIKKMNHNIYSILLYASIPGTVNELIYTVYHINTYADTTNKFFISIIL